MAKNNNAEYIKNKKTLSPNLVTNIEYTISAHIYDCLSYCN